MGSEDVLVEIRPCELRFLVEVKKQSSCCIHLVNKSDQYVAFKVKTTYPKKYCVRPNVGVILPLASRDFTVTMQALKYAPPDLQTKDKFLVQTTVVPLGTADEDIVPAFFSKESDQYIEEKKLKVVIVRLTEPQVEQLMNGVPHAKQTAGVLVAEQTRDNVNEAPNVVNEVPNSLKASFPSLSGTPATCNENSSPLNKCPTILQDFLVPPKQASFTLSESASNVQETSVASVETQFSSTEASVDLKESPPLEYTPAPSEVPSLSDKESTNADNVHIPQVSPDVQDLQMKLNKLEVKFEEAKTLIGKLREANRTTIEERDRLQKDMDSQQLLERGLEPYLTLVASCMAVVYCLTTRVFLKRAGAARSQSRTGFPLLFVIYMAAVGISLGYLLHV